MEGIQMSAGTAPREVKVFQGFTAVDLVTIAAMAAIFRATIYVTQLVGFLFPYNTFGLCLTYGFSMLVAARVVRKTGVFTLTNIAAQLINVFLQGELIIAAVFFMTWSLFADVYVYMRLKAGADPFETPRDMAISTIIMAVSWPVATYLISFPLMFGLEFSVLTNAALVVGGFISVCVGGWVGYHLGNRIKGLIG